MFRARKDYRDARSYLTNTQVQEKLLNTLTKMSENLNELNQNLPRSVSTSDVRQMDSVIKEIKTLIARGGSSGKDSKDRELLNNAISLLKKVDTKYANYSSASVMNTRDAKFISNVEGRISSAESALERTSRESKLSQLASSIQQAGDAFIKVSNYLHLDQLSRGTVGGQNIFQMGIMSARGLGMTENDLNNFYQSSSKMNQQLSTSLFRFQFSMEDTNKYLSTLVTLGYQNIDLAQKSYKTMVTMMKNFEMSQRSSEVMFDLLSLEGGQSISESFSDTASALKLYSKIGTFNDSYMNDVLESKVPGALSGLGLSSSDYSKRLNEILIATTLARNYGLPVEDILSLIAYEHGNNPIGVNEIIQKYHLSDGVRSDIASGNYSGVVQSFADLYADKNMQVVYGNQGIDVTNYLLKSSALAGQHQDVRSYSDYLHNISGRSSGASNTLAQQQNPRNTKVSN